MVYLLGNHDVPVIKGFLWSNMRRESIERIHRGFEHGSGAPFAPIAHLCIVNKREYHGMSKEYIRRDQDSIGNLSPFLIIYRPIPFLGARAIYVGRFANAEEVGSGMANSTGFLFHIHVNVRHSPVMHVNYVNGTNLLVEDMYRAGARTFLMSPSNVPENLFYQPDQEALGYHNNQIAYVIASPGEYVMMQHDTHFHSDTTLDEYSESGEDSCSDNPEYLNVAEYSDDAEHSDDDEPFSRSESSEDEDNDDYDEDPDYTPSVAEDSSDDNNHSKSSLDDGLPRARLLDSVADSAGLLNQWSIVRDIAELPPQNGLTESYPAGSVLLEMRYNVEFPWPPYERISESL